METTELIQRLREIAPCTMPIEVGEIISEAADRLKELDERVAIMSEGEQVTMEELVK